MMDDLAIYRFLVENMTDGVYFVDHERRIVGWNRGAQAISGFAASEVVGRRCRDGILNHVDERGRMLCRNGCPLAATMDDGQPRHVYVWMSRRDGTRMPVRVRSAPVRDTDGTIVGAVEVFTDDSAALSATGRAQELERSGMVDALTGLGNRDYLGVQLTGLCHRWADHSWPFGVWAVEVTGHGTIGERYGREAADQALVLVAGTLGQILGDQAILARYGPTTFVVLQPGADAEQVAQVAEHARRIVGTSRLPVGYRRIPVQIAVGGTAVAAGDSPDDLLARANLLLAQAKRNGTGTAAVA